MSIVLVHGAWHGPWCWSSVVSELEDRGQSVTAVELPLTGFEHDVAAARHAIDEAGKDVVVCGHSYGGLVVDGAVRDGSEVSHVVYLAAITNAGLDLMAATSIPVTEAMVPDGDLTRVNLDVAHALFYADSDASRVAAITPLLRPMKFSGEAFHQHPQPDDPPPSTYVVCTNDGALPADLQRAMAQRCDRTIEWPTDHSPFLTRPGDIADVLVNAKTERSIN